MDLGLKGKRVLITGGTKSIGRAIVDAFVEEGAVVGFCARNAKLVKQREDEWQGKQARVQGAALDVTDDPALKKWVDGFAAEGGIDHFVANVSALGTDAVVDGCLTAGTDLAWGRVMTGLPTAPSGDGVRPSLDGVRTLSLAVPRGSASLRQIEGSRRRVGPFSAHVAGDAPCAPSASTPQTSGEDPGWLRLVRTGIASDPARS